MEGGAVSKQSYSEENPENCSLTEVHLALIHGRQRSIFFFNSTWLVMERREQVEAPGWLGHWQPFLPALLFLSIRLWACVSAISTTGKASPPLLSKPLVYFNRYAFYFVLILLKPNELVPICRFLEGINYCFSEWFSSASIAGKPWFHVVTFFPLHSPHCLPWFGSEPAVKRGTLRGLLFLLCSAAFLLDRWGF